MTKISSTLIISDGVENISVDTTVGYKLNRSSPSLPLLRIGRPHGTASCTLSHSTTIFADNDLGTGALVDLQARVDGRRLPVMTARIKWVEWNRFELEVM